MKHTWPFLFLRINIFNYVSIPHKDISHPILARDGACLQFDGIITYKGM